MSGQIVDLHTHSTYSDGALTPAELVEEAQWKGLAAVALTDHDILDGNGPALAAGAERGLEVIPGVEISCEHERREVHVVGLFIEDHPPLERRLAEIRAARVERMRAMIARLWHLGVRLSMADVPQRPGHSYGRPHLARLMVERGVVKSVQEAFNLYLRDEGPAYVAKVRMPIREAIELIHQAHGVAVLAHPGASGLVEEIQAFARLGIDAVEAYCPKHPKDVEEALVREAKRWDLGLAGGSDFHGAPTGPGLGTPPVSAELLRMLKERKEARWSRSSAS